ncbi:MAG: hypothetical protein AABY22_08340, partial [Nanoarchaeota archaeon]
LDILNNPKIYHIDHIIPIRAFNFNSIWAQNVCFHYTNLQLLHHIINSKKADLINNQSARFLKSLIVDYDSYIKIVGFPPPFNPITN